MKKIYTFNNYINKRNVSLENEQQQGFQLKIKMLFQLSMQELFKEM